jgi:hypothetical protein
MEMENASACWAAGDVTEGIRIVGVIQNEQAHGLSEQRSLLDRLRVFNCAAQVEDIDSEFLILGTRRGVERHEVVGRIINAGCQQTAYVVCHCSWNSGGC